MSKGERHTANQRPDVERVIATRSLDVVAEYEEKASAAKTRLVFDRMMADAHRGAFDVLVVWALDRFGRSMVGNLRDLIELDRCGVQVVSVRETWLDTGSAVPPLLIAIFRWVAEQERAIIVARTKAGLDRARRDGVRLGRPPREVDVRRARALLTDERKAMLDALLVTDEETGRTPLAWLRREAISSKPRSILETPPSQP